MKIARIIAEHKDLTNVSVLDIGCGSGQLLASFRSLVPSMARTVGVDISPCHQQDFEFLLVKDTTLPFTNASFDLVISNHVIEHVGDGDAQHRHLCEIARVLKPDGILYLACPNKWSLVEPHYNLAFLSWLPRKVASQWVRIRKRGTRYEWLPLSRSSYLQRLINAGFSATDETRTAFRLVAQHEVTGPSRKLLIGIPDWAISALMPVIPTFVFVAKHSKPAHGGDRGRERGEARGLGLDRGRFDDQAPT
jgi:ubiquinone/menaquinone biosynthesis C-methylase UbiE